MKKILCLLAVMATLSAAVSAKELMGRTGIGAGADGIGVRYWYSSTSFFDGAVGFTFSNSVKEFQVNGQLGFVLVKKDNVHLIGLGGIGIHSWSADSDNNYMNISLGGGVGVEYFFQELPDLSFGAFVTGLGINIFNQKNNGNSSSSTSFGTQPGLALNVRYYLAK